MTHDCECGRPIHDTATVCVHCGDQMRDALGHVAAYRGLAYDLDVATARQARLGTRDGSRPTETAVPYDQRASEAADKLKTTLVGWARIVATDTGDNPPPDTLADVAAWLRPRIGWLRYHEAGPEACTDILDGVRDARRVIDRPADKAYAGPCDCGADLYAKLDARYVVCRSEVHEEPLAWPVDERRAWLLDSARDVLATTTEISRALTRYQQPVTPEAIRGYVARGQLVARGERAVPGRKPAPLYRLGDILDILARQAERMGA